VHAGLQVRQLLFDLGRGFEVGELLRQRLPAADIQRFRTAFQLIEIALDLLEPGEGVVDALVVDLSVDLQLTFVLD